MVGFSRILAMRESEGEGGGGKTKQDRRGGLKDLPSEKGGEIFTGGDSRWPAFDIPTAR